ncbi:hypothetical protein SK128_028040, partial [Halocaridina rubra]
MNRGIIFSIFIIFVIGINSANGLRCFDCEGNGNYTVECEGSCVGVNVTTGNGSIIAARSACVPTFTNTSCVENVHSEGVHTNICYCNEDLCNEYSCIQLHENATISDMEILEEEFDLNTTLSEVSSTEIVPDGTTPSPDSETGNSTESSGDPDMAQIFESTNDILEVTLSSISNNSSITEISSDHFEMSTTAVDLSGDIKNAEATNDSISTSDLTSRPDNNNIDGIFGEIIARFPSSMAVWMQLLIAIILNLSVIS